MKIIDDLISTLNYEALVREIRQGHFQIAVMTCNCGLASTPRNPGTHHDRASVKEAGLLMEKTVLTLARMAYSSSPLEASIGVATINSLIEVDEQHYAQLNVGDLLAEREKNRKVAVVGHFPFASKLRQVAKELWVIERKPKLGDFAENEAERLIPMAEVVGITSTAFINHTIEQLLNFCKANAYVVVLGGTVPLSPVLFDYVVDAISGTQVVDPAMVLRCVSEGATFREIKGIRLLTMLT